MQRDFTFIDDITEGVVRILEKDVQPRISSKNLYKVYNIGNNNSVKLMDFIKAIENELKIEAKLNLMPMQAGDVEKTWANVDDLISDYNYEPNTTIENGVSSFITWFKQYYKIQ